MNKATGIWGAAEPAEGTAGVFLGGIITAWFDWSWVFHDICSHWNNSSSFNTN